MLFGYWHAAVSMDGDIEKRVLAANAADLDAWFDRAVDAARLDDVFAR